MVISNAIQQILQYAFFHITYTAAATVHISSSTE
jgi:hypothetical protein